MHPRTLIKGLAIGLLVVVGVIHLITAPDQFNDATYKGISFLMNAAGALLAIAGIWQERLWGWLLGLAVAGGAFAAYIISRTVGLPGLPVDREWLEPLGLLSLLVEALFMAVATAVLAPRPAAAGNRGSVATR